jgi:tRNA pseudouridine55 synthase
MATGVIVACVGPATRIAEYVPSDPKEYEAEIHLGIETDTEDVTGETITVADASNVTEADVLRALDSFRGAVMQTPPMVSAVKVGGERLYKLARKGLTVDRSPRRVEIYDLRLLSFEPGQRARLRVRVLCSPGTYIRTLAADLGRSLGTGGALAALTRTRVGPYRLEDAEPIETCQRVRPIAEALPDWPWGMAGCKAAEELRHGRPAATADVRWIRPLVDADRALVEAEDGGLLVIAHVDGECIQPEKVLAAQGDAYHGADG